MRETIRTIWRACLMFALLSAAVTSVCAQQTTKGSPEWRESFTRFERNSTKLPPLFRDSVDTFFHAESAYLRRDYRRASEILGEFWKTYPRGAPLWAQGVQEAHAIAMQGGPNFGTPAAYYALRMLTECVRWKLTATDNDQARMIDWTIVLIGHASGLEFVSSDGPERGKGKTITRSLHPSLYSSESSILDSSVTLFCEYISAITRGRLGVRVRHLRVPDLTVATEIREQQIAVAGVSKKVVSWGLQPGEFHRIWQALEPNTKADTDWWWIIYPSFVPDASGPFGNREFITGGMNVGPDGQSPAFVIDDLWLIRRAPHLGTGLLTNAERLLYMSQWLQHELFHHLFRTYPELELEVDSHQWFDRRRWPKDFQGALEPDYFEEALHKRLQTTTPALHSALRYKQPETRLLEQIEPERLAGTYEARPVLNDWLRGRIEVRSHDPAGALTLAWVNDAGLSWKLMPDIRNAVLRTGTDNPYFMTEPHRGRTLRLVLRRDAQGDYTPDVAGFHFLGIFFAKLPSAPTGNHR